MTGTTARRGFIFTLDALLAMGLALAVIGLLVPFSDTTSLPGHDELHVQRYTADLLMVLQRTGDVRRGLSGNTSALNASLSLTSAGKCFSFRALNMTTSETVFAVNKTGCSTVPATLASAVSNEYYNGQTYRLELLGWVS